jgi:hypothetical protein
MEQKMAESGTAVRRCSDQHSVDRRCGAFMLGVSRVATVRQAHSCAG